MRGKRARAGRAWSDAPATDARGRHVAEGSRVFVWLDRGIVAGVVQRVVGRAVIVEVGRRQLRRRLDEVEVVA